MRIKCQQLYCVTQTGKPVRRGVLGLERSDYNGSCCTVNPPTVRVQEPKNRKSKASIPWALMKMAQLCVRGIS